MTQTRTIKDYDNIYFVGAGGIGMAALVRYCLHANKNVAGYDRTPTVLTHNLIDEGADITFEDSADVIGEAFRNPADTLVVYTPAVPETNSILSYFRKGGFEVVKRAVLLGKITHGMRDLCFAGTHGKTTTSSMAAYILDRAPVGCNAFLGGILRNVGSNLILNGYSDLCVVEADEYDRSFHQLRPYVAVITATDPDHLDIYGTEEAYLESFAHFTELIREDGALLLHTGLKVVPRPVAGVRRYTYSRDEGDFHAANIRRGGGEIVFDIVHPFGDPICDISLGVPVEINIENAVAAVGACLIALGDNQSQLPHEAIRSALARFQGAERRFQFHLKEPMPGGHVIIDDYAHHPDELRQSIASVKALYPESKLTVAFQPHLYSRTRDFADEFASALDLADGGVILLDIYPAREQPIPGVTSKLIFDKLRTDKKVLIPKEKLVDTIKHCNFEILLTAGAGDITDYVDDIVKETAASDHKQG